MTERALTSRRTLLAAVLGQVIAPFVLESGHAAMAGESVASPRQLVPISAGYPVGEIFVSLEERRLYHVRAQARAISYPIATPRDQSLWQGTQKVTAKREWPSWRPTAEMLEENPRLPRFVPGRHRHNPMGARALYLGHTYYRIHGTDAPWLIGQNVSKGCIRMLNDDVIELYESTPLGAKVTVMRQAMLVFPGKASQDDRSRSRQQGSGT